MLKRLVCVSVLWVCSLSSQAEQLPAVQFYLNTAYMCGGIGSDQAAAFRAATASYPLSLHFGQQQNGRVAFVADVQVVIRDEYDQTVLNIESDGPFCLLDIDPGAYRVFATYEGITQEQRTEVKKQGHQLYFTWPQRQVFTQ